MISTLFGIALALFVGNITEWLVHKYILHGLGKKKTSRWSSHFHVHHKRSRKNEFFDEDYLKPIKENEPVKTEIYGVALLVLLNSPSLFFSIPYFVTVCLYAAMYFYLHRKSHLDVEWCKKHLPWHYDHHMGRDQDKNWCVTFPLADYMFGTRFKYWGTQQQKDDDERRAKRKSVSKNGNKEG